MECIIYVNDKVITINEKYIRNLYKIHDKNLQKKNKQNQLCFFCRNFLDDFSEDLEFQEDDIFEENKSKKIVKDHYYCSSCLEYFYCKTHKIFHICDEDRVRCKHINLFKNPLVSYQFHKNTKRCFANFAISFKDKCLTYIRMLISKNGEENYYPICPENCKIHRKLCLYENCINQCEFHYHETIRNVDSLFEIINLPLELVYIIYDYYFLTKGGCAFHRNS